MRWERPDHHVQLHNLIWAIPCYIKIKSNSWPQEGYSEFCLLHRLGLFFGFRILICTILGGEGEGEVAISFLGVLAIYRFFGGWSHFQNWLFLGSIEILVFFFYCFFFFFFFFFFWGGGGGRGGWGWGMMRGGIVRIGVRTVCWTDSCNLVLTALILQCISSILIQSLYRKNKRKLSLL